MSEIVKKWYVVRALSGKEKKVKEYLEAEIARLELQDQVSQVLIPIEKVYQVRNGKHVTKERSFFPGYILLHAALDGEVEHIIKNVSGVIGFLKTKDGHAIPLRNDEIARILGKVDELAESDEEVSMLFYVGEPVKVIDGPFSGFSGVIEEVYDEKKKLKVMVKIFGRKTPLELRFVQVEKE
ncbi:MAG: transcription termination/antitermination protein NusG [Bacteroidales bacterium]|jgi:transcriptional antiterminator NusG|nr:transcription termination/antitermination protein NusG [Bacteroidales bacterium]MCK9498237.1 transcription termination/antitermination protein NusG [Bacteroidales bacterium]MDY0315245.1 transcription termination/antitermination protein NusG [Bacteroidales bacterium]